MAMFITLQRRGGSTFETWATSLIEKDIDAQMVEADKAAKHRDVNIGILCFFVNNY